MYWDGQRWLPEDPIRHAVRVAAALLGTLAVFVGTTQGDPALAISGIVMWRVATDDHARCRRPV